MILLTIFNPASSINIECIYETINMFGSIYTCQVKTNTYIISPDSVDILTAKGTHKNGSNNNDVLGIRAENSKFLYFPHGLKKIFKKLRTIWIESCQMKEIHQTDLMLYPDLEILCIGGNDIQVFEEDLFKYNPDLRVISCWSCKIFHIDPKVFDNLSKLSDIWLVLNQCIDKKSDGSLVSVDEMIGKVKDKCVSPAFLILKEKLDDFEDANKNLHIEKFHEKLEVLEQELKSSKFYNFPSLKKKIDEYKVLIIQKSCKIDNLNAGSFKAEEITALNMKINDIESDLKISITDTSKDMENLVKNLQAAHNEGVTALKDKIEGLRSSNENLSNKIEKITNKFDKFAEILKKIDENVSRCVQT